MKKLILPVLSLMMVVSCSKSSDDAINDGALVPIKLGAGVNTIIIPKAPIGSGVESTYGIAGWESSTAADYTAAPIWNTTFKVTSNTTAAAITWTAAQFYNADGAIKTYIKAWHPAGALAGKVVTFANAAGDNDVMLPKAVVSGSKTTVVSEALDFEHKTAQISFVVIGGDGYTGGTELQSITVNGVELPTSLDLEANTITYGAPAPLAISNITANLAIPVVGGTAAKAGDPIMVKGMTGKTFTVDVVTNKASYTGQTVTVTTATVAEGTSYVITLTFKQSGVELEAKIADWVTSTGAGDIM